MPSLEVGIVGLPNAGKSTLFNALLGRQIANVAEYPFTTIEPNVGVVEVPDERLVRLAKVISQKTQKTVQNNSEQLSESDGQNIGESERRKIRNSETPTFRRSEFSEFSDRPSYSEFSGIKVVPAAIKFIDIAGLVKDAHKGAGLGNRFLAKIREANAILHVVRVFDNPQAAHPLGGVNPERDIEIINNELKQAGIQKPTFVYLNKEYPNESALDEIIKSCYSLLDLVTMFTVEGGHQIQAWPVKRGTVIGQAVEMIHSDFAKKFIRAEVVPFDKFDAAGSYSEAKLKGWIRVEGKDYVVKDGDVVTVKI